jgi:hypothetical protein
LDPSEQAQVERMWNNNMLTTPNRLDANLLLDARTRQILAETQRRRRTRQSLISNRVWYSAVDGHQDGRVGIATSQAC